MVVEGDAVHRGFDRRVEQFDHKNQQDAGNHQRTAEIGGRQKQCGWNQHQGQPDFLAKGVLVAIGGGQSSQGIVEGIPDPGQAGLALERAFVGGDGHGGEGDLGLGMHDSLGRIAGRGG